MGFLRLDPKDSVGDKGCVEFMSQKEVRSLSRGGDNRDREVS